MAVLDAFHVVKLGLQAMEETRRRVQQEQLGHRGRKNDPLYGIRNALRAGTEKLTDRQIDASKPDCKQVTRPGRSPSPGRLLPAAPLRVRVQGLRQGHKIAAQVLESFHTCPVPEIARLGRTLRSWPRSSWPTSPPAAPTTAAPRQSTASSSSTAASPAASATPPTTGYG